MDETVPMLYRPYPRSLDRQTLFADVMTKVAHSPLLLFKTLCVGPVWPLHQKTIKPFSTDCRETEKGSSHYGQGRKIIMSPPELREMAHTHIDNKLTFFFHRGGLGPNVVEF